MDNAIDKLKDIKNIVELPIDFIPYVILGVIFLILFGVVYLIFRFKKHKKLSKKEKIRLYLKKYDFNQEAKKIAYDFTILAKEVISQKDLDEYYKIVNELYIYKYKKNTPSVMPKELINEIKEFIKVRI